VTNVAARQEIFRHTVGEHFASEETKASQKLEHDLQKKFHAGQAESPARPPASSSAG